jgi:peptide/nickel transport system substrate-binding protein
VPERPRRTPRFALALAAALAAPTAGAAAAQQQLPAGRRDAIVVVSGAEPRVFVPIAVANTGLQNQDIVDQLFLKLAVPGTSLNTVGDRGFEPRLARSWTRRDSLTLVFEMDPRARWHDGAPVTAQDVAFTYARARDAKAPGILRYLLRDVESVTAEDSAHAVFRFRRGYREQFYDATYHVAILPEHLCAPIPTDELATSAFGKAPVGSGPYRFVRAVPGQFVELAANERFFLGTPAIPRFVMRFAADQESRINYLLSGEGDVLETVIPPVSNVARVNADPRLRIVFAPSLTVGYILFNQRDRADTARPHPLLGDPDVRRALVMGLDRRSVTRAAYAGYATVPVGPASQLLGLTGGSSLRYDPAGARRLLAARGWADHDGDGILDKDGRPFSLVLAIPNTSPVRQLVAQAAERQWRALGVAVEIAQSDFAGFIGRLNRGDYDMIIGSAIQDPSPSEIAQSWSCAGVGGGNSAHFCDPAVDSLLDQARYGPGDPRPLWNAAVRRIEADAPAAFVYAPSYAVAVPKRFGHVRLRPESWWSSVWEWTLEPGR